MSESTATAPRQSDPDRDLVRQAKAGSYEAFEELVGRHEQGIYALAHRITGNAADAEEVVQETFLSVVEHLGDFAEQSAFRTWLTRIAMNHALKVLRRHRSRPAVSLQRAEDESPVPHPEFIAPWREDPAELVQQKETRQLLDEAIDALPEIYRLVFVLRDVQGLSTEETADALGISIANTKVRLLRARLMLRERLTRVLGDAARRVVSDHTHD